MAKEYLLAEHSKYHEAFAKNEELGERRVQFFLGLVTAAVGAMVLLATTDKGPITSYPIYIVWTAFVLAVLLLAAGLVTYDRLLKRDETTTEYQALLDCVRKRFIEAAASPAGVVSLQGYDPFPENGPKLLKRIGRLARLTLVINTWIACVGTVLFRCCLTGWPDRRAEAVTVALLSIAVGAAALIGQWGWWKWKYAAST